MYEFFLVVHAHSSLYVFVFVCVCVFLFDYVITLSGLFRNQTALTKEAMKLHAVPLTIDT